MLKIGSLVITTANEVAGGVNAVEKLLQINGTSLAKQMDSASRIRVAREKRAVELRQRGEQRLESASEEHRNAVAAADLIFQTQSNIAKGDLAKADSVEEQAQEIAEILAALGN